MATPKMDRILTEFMSRIGDPVTISGAMGNGKIITADKAIDFVNRAMFKLLNDTAATLGFSEAELCRVFPELITTATITTSSGGTYTIAANNLDFWLLIDGTYSSNTILIQKQNQSLYNMFLTGRNTRAAATAAYPVVFHMNTVLNFMPAATFNAISVNITYIKQPLNPTSGAFLTQNGSYDSPFSNLWNSKLAEIAQQLFLIEAQENS